MIRQQLARLLAVILTISCIAGSVGMTALASEADSLSTDIVMSENSEDASASDERPETAPVTGREEETAEEELSAFSEAEEADGDSGQQEFQEGSEEQEDSAADSPEETEAGESPEQSEETGEEPPVSPENSEETEPGTDGEQPEEAGSAPPEVKENAAGREQAVSDQAAEENIAEKGKEAGKTEAVVTETSLSLSPEKVTVYVGKTASLKAVITFTAGSMEEAEEIAAGMTWSIGSGKAAEIKSVGKAVITAEEQSADTEDTEEPSGEAAEGQGGEEEPGTASGGDETAAAVTGTITQSVTVGALAEGQAVVTVKGGSESKKCTVTVKPVPVALGKGTNLRWTSTTILRWDAVKNTKQYQVIVSLVNGTKTYTKTVTVTGKTYVDLESQINALIKANKAALSGAAYTVTASVRAIATDTAHYKNGAAAKAPSFRYLRSNFQESVSRNGWFLRDGKWYFYDAGVKKTGWIWFLAKKYYLGDDGIMRTSCWVGNKYLKSNGEMATDEWVDGFRYYVDAQGNKVKDEVFSVKRWVKTKNGWRYKRVNGTYAKNGWLTISHRTYYFDSEGYARAGWITQNGKKYFLNNSGDIASGYGARCTGWKTVGSYTYWFDDNGVMAKNSWVDRNQYYVGGTGHKLSWITYANLRNVNTSNRLGYYVYSHGTPPEQSIAGYDLSYKKGNRIMVVDLLFTKDNIPVCFHDNEVKYARLKDGERPSSPPNVSKMTLAQLRQFDYGISSGEAYKGTPPLTLEEMAKWIRSHSDTEMYIEVKAASMNAEQIKKTTALLAKYKITDRSSMIFGVKSADDTRAQRVHKAAPTLRIGFMTKTIGATVYSQIAKAQGTNNEVFLWCWPDTKLTTSAVRTLRSKNTLFEFGTLDTFDEIISYYSKGTAYSYTSGVETDGAVFRNLLSTATFHDAAKWVSAGASWKYKQIDGTFARSKWLTIGGKNYHFNSKGLMQTGWLNIGGKLYYLDAKGIMVTGTRTIAGKKYTFGSDGVMVK